MAWIRSRGLREVRGAGVRLRANDGGVVALSAVSELV